jgi:hypothetical protein
MPNIRDKEIETPQRKHPEMVEFITDVLNHFATNGGEDGKFDWRDFFSEEDIEKWIVDTQKLTKEMNQMPKKFWIVMTWGNNYKGGIQRWPTYEEAAKCAEKITHQLLGTKVYILEALDYRQIPCPKPPPIEYHILEKAEK